MATAVKFQDFVEQLGKGVHNFGTHTLKVALTNSAPSASTNTVLADITQISNGNGYTTGGATVGSVTYTESGGTGTLAGADVVFTATGSVGPFRYAVLYNDTPTSPADPLIAYWDYGSSITLANGETFTVDWGASILTVS
jgi:hypothetical protein